MLAPVALLRLAWLRRSSWSGASAPALLRVLLLALIVLGAALDAGGLRPLGALVRVDLPGVR